MNILPLSLFCLCLCCGFSRGGQPPEGAPVRFRINMDQAAGNKAPSTGPVPDQSTPLNAAKLLLRALQEKTDWKHEPYKSLPATSPFVSQLRQKSILSRMEAVQGYVTGAAPERPPFVDEDSIIAEGDLAMAYILLPDKANPYVYAATAVALVKKEGQWKASLTPGSFDNTFLPFDDGIREKAKKISSEAKKKIFGLAHQYSVAAVKAALEHIKRFRQENVRGTTDDELKNLLIRAVKGDDPALIAALLVSPYYTESAITQSARLIPVVKAMRLQDRREENRYIQPTHLSFMTFPNTILVPLSPHPDDQMAPNSREEDQQEEANKKQREEERQGHPQHRSHDHPAAAHEHAGHRQTRSHLPLCAGKNQGSHRRPSRLQDEPDGRFRFLESETGRIHHRPHHGGFPPDVSSAVLSHAGRSRNRRRPRPGEPGQPGHDAHAGPVQLRLREGI